MNGTWKKNSCMEDSGKFWGKNVLHVIAVLILRFYLHTLIWNIYCVFGLFSLFLLSEGLNSILFAINIDNKDLNGQSKSTPTVSDLLKESTQNVTSLLKESTQGVSSLLREITASSAVSILMKPDQDTDPLPVLSKNVNAGKRFCNVSVIQKLKNIQMCLMRYYGTKPLKISALHIQTSWVWNKKYEIL